LGGVIAGVEDEQRHRPVIGQPAKQRADLGGEGVVGCPPPGAAGGRQPGGPGIAIEAELRDPLKAQPAMIGWPAECREGW
jgi:hypothetical protein